jgi:hypothetical protein
MNQPQPNQPQPIPAKPQSLMKVWNGQIRIKGAQQGIQLQVLADTLPNAMLKLLGTLADLNVVIDGLIIEPGTIIVPGLPPAPPRS